MSDGIGTGATVAFDTSTFTGKITDMKIDGEEVPVVDKTGMSDTGFRCKDFGVLAEPPEVTLETIFDVDALPPAPGTKDRITITFRGGGTYNGTGAITSRSASIPLEDVMTGSFKFKFDGLEGPTFTAGSP